MNTLETFAEVFYKEILSHINHEKVPYMLGGTYAFSQYTGIKRHTKDLDLFLKRSDYPRILQRLNKAGYETEITDERWLAKVKKGKDFVDFIFGTAHGVAPVDDTWFKHAPTVIFLNHRVRLIPVEELIWSKSFMHDRERAGGPDVNHLILKKGDQIDWKRLLMRLDPHWEILFSHLLQFRFVYPSERGIVPIWLLEELVQRVRQEFEMPIPKERVSRGPLLSRNDYIIDIEQWGFKDVL